MAKFFAYLGLSGLLVGISWLLNLLAIHDIAAGLQTVSGELWPITFLAFGVGAIC